METLNNVKEIKKRRGRPKKDEVKASENKPTKRRKKSEEVEASENKPTKRRKKSEETAEQSIDKNENITSNIEENDANNTHSCENNSVSDNSGWNNINIDTKKLCVEFMNVEIELLRDALGMMPSDPDILSNFIASKAPDALSRSEEIEIYGKEETERKQTTIWPIANFVYDKEHDIFIDKGDVYTDKEIKCLPNDDPSVQKLYFIYDYQIKGMFKDSCGMLNRAKDSNLSSGLKAYKKVIDGGIYVFPRHIGFFINDQYVDEFGNIQNTYDETGRLKVFQRAFRTSGPQGDRTALASSEVIPAGSRIKFTIGVTSKSFMRYVKEWLDYGCIRGIGQWRNSGTGIFRWRMLNENWEP